MTHFLEGKVFDKFAEFEIAVQQFFDSQPKKWCPCVIEQLASRRLITVDNEKKRFEN